jgi:hypothetical protein
MDQVKIVINDYCCLQLPFINNIVDLHLFDKKSAYLLAVYNSIRMSVLSYILL